MTISSLNETLPSICFIVPFFDEKKRLAFLRKKKLPIYFEHFLGTFYRNRNISLKIFTNADNAKYRYYCQNTQITFHHISLKNIFQLFKHKLQISGFGYKEFRAYKICDYKPMFGLVFSEYLQGFDYWGYCDIDMIMGNLEKFLSLENINGYDMIWGTNRLSGYMTLYKNTDSMNYLFQKSPDCLKVINSHENWRFDESGNKGIVAMEQVVEQEYINYKKINFVHNDCGSNNVSRQWRYLWENGKLTDDLTKEEIGALHFVKSKKKPEFIINDFKVDSSFSISQTGFSLPIKDSSVLN